MHDEAKQGNDGAAAPLTKGILQEIEEMTKNMNYADYVYNMINMCISEGIDIEKRLIYELESAKKNLDTQKLKFDIDLADKTLNTDWDKVNKERKAKGLVNISNDKLRKDYVDIEMQTQKENLNTLEREYEILKRIYEKVTRRV